jgi:hypothetical protein
MQTDKHRFYFSGYSDDVVLAGPCQRDFDEYYSTFYLLSNGLVIKAEHGDNGWEIGLSEEHNSDITIIPAVDVDDEGIEHGDTRLPEWLRDSAPGYAPVCIIETDEPLEIVAQSDCMFSDNSPEFIKAAKLRKAVMKEADCEEDECPNVEAFKVALKNLNL